jgi:alginate O-acetyltransferase complex protein AlgJ
MSALQKYYLIVAFLLLLALPMINVGGWIFHFERKNENRNFQDSVNIDWRHLDNFSGDFDKYLNDNFSFRSPLLQLVHRIQFNIFHVPLHREDVIMGKNGWYFLGGEEKDIYEGRENFSAEEMLSFKRVWSERLSFLQERKIPTFWLICPTKLQVYDQYLPPSVRMKFQKSRTQLLSEYLNNTFPGLVLDPTDELKAYSNHTQTYFKLDNHWNARAGWFVTKHVLEAMQRKFPLIEASFLNNYTWSDSIKTDGIHKTTLGIDELHERVPYTSNGPNEAVSIKKYGFPSPESFPYGWKYEERFKKASKKGLRILVFRDSFADDIIPFMKEAFGESVFIFDNWEYGLHPDIIEKVNPDIVLYITLETHLSNLIDTKSKPNR